MGALTVGGDPSGVPEGSTARMINHEEHGQVATFYPDTISKPLVSFAALFWGPLGSRVRAATEGKQYGEPGYGLHFDQQLPAGSTIDDALAAVQTRLDALDAATEVL